MNCEAVDVIVVLPEEGLGVGGFVVDNAKCSTVVDELLAVLSVKEVVAHIVAAVSKDILEFEVGIGG